MTVDKIKEEIIALADRLGSDISLEEYIDLMGDLSDEFKSRYDAGQDDLNHGR